MHAFMTAVLLRMAGRDALQSDAEPQPDGEFAESVQRMRGGERDWLLCHNSWQDTAL